MDPGVAVDLADVEAFEESGLRVELGLARRGAQWCTHYTHLKPAWPGRMAI